MDQELSAVLATLKSLRDAQIIAVHRLYLALPNFDRFPSSVARQYPDATAYRFTGRKSHLDDVKAAEQLLTLLQTAISDLYVGKYANALCVMSGVLRQLQDEERRGFRCVDINPELYSLNALWGLSRPEPKTIDYLGPRGLKYDAVLGLQIFLLSKMLGRTRSEAS